MNTKVRYEVEGKSVPTDTHSGLFELVPITKIYATMKGTHRRVQVSLADSDPEERFSTLVESMGETYSKMVLVTEYWRRYTPTNIFVGRTPDKIEVSMTHSF